MQYIKIMNIKIRISNLKALKIPNILLIFWELNGYNNWIPLLLMAMAVTGISWALKSC
jgi:hypothetical protein